MFNKKESHSEGNLLNMLHLNKISECFSSVKHNKILTE